MSSPDVRTVSYDHPDAQTLIAEVQLEYVSRYGGPDESPIDPDDFAEPNGLFVVAYSEAGHGGGQPVAMGGWRRRLMVDGAPAGEIAAELKRMYVRPVARGRGYARATLAHLESSAAAAGIGWVVLETGSKQPEAVELYRSAGYQQIEPFGHYACAPLSLHLARALIVAAR